MMAGVEVLEPVFKIIKTKIMKPIITIALVSIIMLSFKQHLTTSIYNFHFKSLSNDSMISMSQYQGKKMLLVNMASESPFAAVQIPQLEQLYQQYKDSLVVIGFFSNDFSNEPREDNVLRLLMTNTYHSTFPASVRISVKDSTGTTDALYNWLQHKSENGMMDVKVKRDFQKYLVEKDGTLVGVFSGKVNPMDPQIINAITQ